MGEVTETVASVMRLGVWAFGSNPDGSPEDELPFKADELGDELVTQMQDAVKTYKSIGDVIVTDSAKLAFVGANGNCNPTSGQCPEGYSFTTDDDRRVSADLHRAVERVAYEELLPLGFHVFGLNRQYHDGPPDPRWYRCAPFGAPYYPWWYYSPLAVSLATTAELMELDPVHPGRSTWKVLVLARPPGRTTYHGQPPSEKLLKRAFGPVSPTNDPTDGGLGISSSRLMREAEWHFWDGRRFADGVDGGRDYCS